MQVRLHLFGRSEYLYLNEHALSYLNRKQHLSCAQRHLHLRPLVTAVKLFRIASSAVVAFWRDYQGERQWATILAFEMSGEATPNSEGESAAEVKYALTL